MQQGMLCLRMLWCISNNEQKGRVMRKLLPITVTVGLSMFSLSAPLAAQEVSKEVLSIAAKVHTGALVCEDRKLIMLWPDTALPGRFILKMNKRVYHLTPVPTASGAVRLEDDHTGAVWIQTSEKSMLMDSVRSQRLADECQSPAQKTAVKQIPASARPDLLEANSNNR
jgi:hypothetical protein